MKNHEYPATALGCFLSALVVAALAWAACRAAPDTAHQDALATEISAVFDAKRTALAAYVAPRLYRIDVPAGTRSTINVKWNGGATIENLNPDAWLSIDADRDGTPDYDGVEFVGAGQGKTFIDFAGWNGAVNVGAHDGVVGLRDMTIYCGYDIGVRMGEQNTAQRIYKRFQERLVNVTIIVRPPPPGVSRTKWPNFTYQCDQFLQNVTIIGKEAREHDSYGHGFSQFGAWVEGCNFVSAGAEGYKLRPDMTETAAVLGTKVTILNCKFGDWRQPHSDRGGAAIVLQNACSDVLIQGCSFMPRLGDADPVAWNDRSHCIEIASEDNGYSLTNGTGAQFGNGVVVVRNSSMYGKSLVDWNNTVLRIADNGRGNKLAAKAVLVENSGIWGSGVIVNISDVPTGKTLVRGCNTPAIAAFCKARGFDVSSEAMWPGPNRRTPISAGASR